MPPTIGEKIIQFSGTAGENQTAAPTLINDVTNRAVKIEKYPLRVFFETNFRIPDYQRGYQWEEEQWEELWSEIDDIFQVDETSADQKVNDVFFGSMFFAERESDEVEEDDIEEIYDVIDGQQQLTTLSILFKILADKLYECTDAERDLLRDLSGETANIENLIYRSVGAGTEDNVSLLPNRHHQEGKI